VPEPGESGPGEIAVADAAAAAAERVDVHVRRNEFHRALESIFAFTDTVNRYLEERAPWKVAKAKQAGFESHVATTLYTSCESLRVVALLLAAFLPDTAPRILTRLGIPNALDGARLPDDAARWGVLAPGTPTTKGDALFPRIESEA
jgi:methionyl-tRNA synthetase